MTVETTEAAAKNVHAFLTIFFETFDQFKGRRLHLAGESYGVIAWRKPYRLAGAKLELFNRVDIFRHSQVKLSTRTRLRRRKAVRL